MMTVVTALLTTLFLSIAANATADPWVVTNQTSAGPGSLDEALTASASQHHTTIDLTHLSGVVELADRSYSISNSLTIVGPGPALLSVDARFKARHFQVAPAGTLTLMGITLTKGLPEADESGGSIHNLGTLVLSNCWFTTNVCSGGFGGAVFSQGRMVAQNCKFIGNAVCGSEGETMDPPPPQPDVFYAVGGAGAGFGGALMVDTGEADLFDTHFLGNFTTGAANPRRVYCPASRPRATKIPGRGGGPEGGVSGQNGGFGSGGGVLNSNPGFGGGRAFLARWGFFDKSETGGSAGGAVFIRSGNLRALRCQFERNTSHGNYDNLGSANAVSGGGALFLYNGSLLLEACGLASNSAAYGSGGALYQVSGSLSIESSSLVSNNIASPHWKESLGSGLFARGGVATIRNSTFAWNAIQGEAGTFGSTSSDVAAGGGSGCAIAVTNSQIRLEHCTVVNNVGTVGKTAGIFIDCTPLWKNSLPAQAGGLWNLGGQVSLRGNLFTGNGCYEGLCPGSYLPTPSPSLNRQEIMGNVISEGFNLITSPQGVEGLIASDLPWVAARLLGLKRTIGGVDFAALSAGSEGINCVPQNLLPSRDQIGTDRPQGPYGEVGAIERLSDNTVPPPIPVQGLYSISAPHGSEVELNPWVWSIGPTRYVWFKDGQAIPGATGAVYRLTNVSLEDEGKYSVRIDGEGGSIDRGPIPLRLDPGEIDVLEWNRYSGGWLAEPILLNREPTLFLVAAPTPRDFDRLLVDPIHQIENYSVGYELTGSGGFLSARGITGITQTNFPTAFRSRGDGVFSALRVDYAQTTSGQEWKLESRAFDENWITTNMKQSSVRGAQQVSLSLAPNRRPESLYRIEQGQGSTNVVTLIDEDLQSRWALSRRGKVRAAGGLAHTFVLSTEYDAEIGDSTLVIDGIDAQGKQKWTRKIRDDVTRSISAGWRDDEDSPILACTANGQMASLLIDAELPLTLTGTQSGDKKLTVGHSILVALDADGEHLWNRSIPLSPNVKARAICLDDLGNCFICVSGVYDATEGDLFGNDAARDGRTALGVIKLDRNGDSIWTKLRSLPRGGTLGRVSLTPDAFGGILIAGSIWYANVPLSEADLRPQSAELQQTSSFDFLVRFEPTARLRLDSPFGTISRLTLLSEPAHPWQLEQSEDLRVWRSLGVAARESGVTEVSLDQSESRVRFYRARSMPFSN